MRLKRSRESLRSMYSYKRLKGRSHTVEKRKASHPQKPHATSQPSRFSHTPRLSTDAAHREPFRSFFACFDGHSPVVRRTASYVRAPCLHVAAEKYDRVGDCLWGSKRPVEWAPACPRAARVPLLTLVWKPRAQRVLPDVVTKE